MISRVLFALFLSTVSAAWAADTSDDAARWPRTRGGRIADGPFGRKTRTFEASRRIVKPAAEAGSGPGGPRFLRGGR